MPSDTELLDWLESQNARALYTGRKWSRSYSAARWYAARCVARAAGRVGKRFSESQILIRQGA